ncbi:hypothetical protein LJR219_005037 [Phenylobacterium sp. LjRoot219]|uniref:hypothetical protein n=1 Tax=Phenylobacterium sp. LjRoot219 TaxID=3342283 RepID=UPI003ECCD83E
MRNEITGPIGSGKTTLGWLLAREFGLRAVNKGPEEKPFGAKTYDENGGALARLRPQAGAWL